MKPASAKAKGRKLQNVVRDRIKDLYGFEPDTAVMGERGKDVKDDRLPYSIECKNVEKLNLWAAWKQAKDNLFEGDTPVVILTRNHADTLAVVPAEWFLARLEIREHDTVQPERSREGKGKDRSIPVEVNGSHLTRDTRGCDCLVRRCLESCGWLRPSAPED